VLLIFIAICAPALCSAQVVTYDWEAKGDKPESFPAQLSKKELVTFQIRNVNDILYTYHLRVSLTPIPNNDWQNIAGLPPFSFGGAFVRTVNCDKLLSDAQQYQAKINSEINSTSNTKLPVGYAALAKKDQKSVPLRETLAQWNEKIRPSLDNLRETANNIFNQCTDQTFATEYAEFQRLIKPIEDRVNGPHVYTNQYEIPPGTNVEATVLELYNGETLTTATFKFAVESNVLTLSAGAMFSRIQDRSYEAVKVPGMTENVLVVQGNSRVVPAVVALLNYSLPLGLNDDTAGLAISAGPIVRFGNKSDASSLGFFTGISGQLYRRFYITPGVNIAQFADFPQGFSNGSTVPANFGALTPVKRWTARFGLAITFKTTSFSGLTGSAATKEGKVDVKETPKTTENRRLKDIDPLNPVPSNSLAGHALVNNIVAQGKEVAVSNLYVSSSLEKPSLLRTVSLSNTGMSGAVCVTINSNAEVRDYKVYSENGRLYIIIPNAELADEQAPLGAGSLKAVKAERRGADLVLAFVLPPGAKPRVQENSNRLDVLFMK
jgi:hypothetical protein